MKRTLTALALVATLGAVSAPVANAMQQELTMLELAVGNAMNRLGITGYDINELTVGQLAQIKGEIESDNSDGVKKRNVEAIIAK